LKTKFFMDDVIIGKIKIIKSEIELNNIYMTIKKENVLGFGFLDIE